MQAFDALKTTITMPLRKLNPATVRALKTKYPEAEISLEISSKRAANAFSEANFWAVIALFEWSKTEEGDDEKVVEPAIAALARGPIRSIYAFADLLSEKLFALDGEAFATQIGADSWKEGGFFSVDNFLYARACAVANGRDFFEKALAAPAEMPKDLAFEELLYVASAAFERKTGRKWDYQAAFPMETFSNRAGWKNRKSAKSI